MTAATDTDTAAQDGAPHLRPPDTREHDGRRIVYEWEIANDGRGHRLLAVLTIGFRKAGIDYANYEQHPTEYTAGLRTEEEDTTSGHLARTYWGLTTLGLSRESTSRFSQAGLARFAQAAEHDLKARYAAEDTKVLRYFNNEPLSSLAPTESPKE